MTDAAHPERGASRSQRAGGGKVVKLLSDEVLQK